LRSREEISTAKIAKSAKNFLGGDWRFLFGKADAVVEIFIANAQSKEALVFFENACPLIAEATDGLSVGSGTCRLVCLQESDPSSKASGSVFFASHPGLTRQPTFSGPSRSHTYEVKLGAVSFRDIKTDVRSLSALEQHFSRKGRDVLMKELQERALGLMRGKGWEGFRRRGCATAKIKQGGDGKQPRDTGSGSGKKGHVGMNHG